MAAVEVDSRGSTVTASPVSRLRRRRTRSISNPAISPDGTFVASNRIDPQTGNWDIWLLDLARNLPSKLTTDPATDSDPVWSPDGKEIAYVSDRDGRLGVYKQSVAGGPAELLLDVSTDRAAVLSDWSANGHIILHRAAGRPWSIWALNVADRKATRLVDDRFSPYRRPCLARRQVAGLQLVRIGSG